MKLFGPLRLYWEGGWKGEGIIKELKEVIRDGLKKNWQENTLKRVYNGRALDYMLNLNGFIFENKSELKNYIKYSSLAEFLNKFRGHDAISVIILKNYKHIVAIGTNGYCILHRKGIHSETYNNNYHYWSVDEELHINFPNNDEILCYGIMLPWYDLLNDKQISYSITPSYMCIYDDWKEFYGNKFDIDRNIEIEDIGYMYE